MPHKQKQKQTNKQKTKQKISYYINRQYF